MEFKLLFFVFFFFFANINSLPTIAPPLQTTERLIFTIDKTLNGVPINANDQVKVTLEVVVANDLDPNEFDLTDLTSNEPILRVDIEAPFYNNPQPGGQPGKPFPGLWEYEMVGLFFSNDQNQYMELEIAPGGQYLVLLYNGARNTIRHSLPLRVDTIMDAATWTGTALVPFQYLPSKVSKFNAYAIHGVEPNRNYLSLHTDTTEAQQADLHNPALLKPIDLDILQHGQNILRNDQISPIWASAIDGIFVYKLDDQWNGTKSEGFLTEATLQGFEGGVEINYTMPRNVNGYPPRSFNLIFENSDGESTGLDLYANGRRKAKFFVDRIDDLRNQKLSLDYRVYAKDTNYVKGSILVPPQYFAPNVNQVNMFAMFGRESIRVLTLKPLSKDQTNITSPNLRSADHFQTIDFDMLVTSNSEYSTFWKQMIDHHKNEEEELSLIEATTTSNIEQEEIILKPDVTAIEETEDIVTEKVPQAKNTEAEDLSSQITTSTAQDNVMSESIDNEPTGANNMEEKEVVIENQNLSKDKKVIVEKTQSEDDLKIIKDPVADDTIVQNNNKKVFDENNDSKRKAENEAFIQPVVDDSEPNILTVPEKDATKNIEKPTGDKIQTESKHDTVSEKDATQNIEKSTGDKIQTEYKHNTVSEKDATKNIEKPTGDKIQTKSKHDTVSEKDAPKNIEKPTGDKIQTEYKHDTVSEKDAIKNIEKPTGDKIKIESKDDSVSEKGDYIENVEKPTGDKTQTRPKDDPKGNEDSEINDSSAVKTRSNSRSPITEPNQNKKTNDNVENINENKQRKRLIGIPVPPRFMVEKRNGLSSHEREEYQRRYEETGSDKNVLPITFRVMIKNIDKLEISTSDGKKTETTHRQNTETTDGQNTETSGRQNTKTRERQKNKTIYVQNTETSGTQRTETTGTDNSQATESKQSKKGESETRDSFRSKGEQQEVENNINIDSLIPLTEDEEALIENSLIEDALINDTFVDEYDQKDLPPTTINPLDSNTEDNKRVNLLELIQSLFPPTHHICYREGLIRDEIRCQVFYECVMENNKWEMYSWRCKRGMYFDEEKIECLRGFC